MASLALRSFKSMEPEGQSQTAQNVGGSTKGLNIQYVVQLSEVGEGLMAKMYRPNQILDHSDMVNHLFSESFWKAGMIPNFPKICTLVARKFSEHTSILQLEHVDKIAFDSLTDGAEVYLQNLEPWVQYFKQVPHTYSQQMINELRERWISYVTGYHQPNDNDDDLCEL